MTHGSLYSGIGGWLLAARWAGIENIFTVEIDGFCNKVLKKHFKVEQYRDIREFNGGKYRRAIDILSTSDPCQPFSFAGKRGGTKDDRFLWPQTIRVIREIKPSYVVFENVPGFSSMVHEYRRERVGVESKASFKGKYKTHIYNTWESNVFKGVIKDLEEEGYTVESFIIPACAVGAWHRRDRLWVIAYTNNPGSRTPGSGINKNGQEEKQGRERQPRFEFNGYHQDVSNTECQGLQGESIGQVGESGKFTESSKDVSDPDKPRFETGQGGEITGNTEQSSWRNAKNGRIWESEPGICRVAHGIPSRVDRLKSLGNSIVPQIAYIIFEAIKQYDQH